MLRNGTEKNWLDRRTTLPTEKSSAEIARDIPPEIRLRSFFSARVAEPHIAERFHQISDDYNNGRIGRDEARNLMKQYAREQGRDDGSAGLKNLGSTARLNLIIDQNAKMARAIGRYERMYSPGGLEAFPYVIYHASVGSKNPRSSHQRYDGMIFAKDDPWLKSHWPPWEFGCNCELENCSAKKAGKTPELIQEKSPPEVAEPFYNRSGFVFDPAKAFSEYDMSAIKDDAARRNTYRDMAQIAMRTDRETTFLAAPAKPVPTCVEPENLDEIKQVIGSVKKAVDEHKNNTPYEFPETKCSLGYIAKERFDAIGMQPEDDVEVIFESPGKSDYGMRHWKSHHLEDWKRADFETYLLKMLSATIWNPAAKMTNTLSQAGKRISITSPDGRYIANLWRKGKNWGYSIQDAWDWDKSGSKKN